MLNCFSKKAGCKYVSKSMRFIRSKPFYMPIYCPTVPSGFKIDDVQGFIKSNSELKVLLITKIKIKYLDRKKSFYPRRYILFPL